MSAKKKPIGDPMPDAPQPIANIELERALLGCLLTNNLAFERVEGILQPEDFYDPVHGRIFDYSCKLVEQARPVSPITLRTYLDGNVDLGELTIPQYLAALAAQSTTIINAHEFAKEIKRLAQRRQLVEVAKHVLAMAPDMRPDQDVNGVIESFSGMLEEIKSSAAGNDNTISMKDALKKGLQSIADAFEKGEAIAGMSTGLTDLDEAIGGLARSNVVVLAARPAMGKTAMVLGWMSSVAQRHPDQTVLFFSQEMSAEDIALRAISEVSGIPVPRLKSGKVTQDEIGDLRSMVDALGEKLASIELVTDSSVKLSFIRAQCRKWKRKRPIALIVIDYIQLMQGPGEVRARKGSRQEELSVITAGMKSVAKENDCNVVLLSQLSRKCEDRDDKRPQLADLRESGSIEQDADAVLGLYREEYYLQQSKPKDGDRDGWDRWNAAMDRWKGIAEILILKNRHGSTEPVYVGWTGKTTSFRNLSETEKERSPDDERSVARIYINKPFQGSYHAIKRAIASVGAPVNADGVVADRSVTSTTECFHAFLKGIPMLEGDEPETIEKEARKDFSKALNWLVAEGVIGFKQMPGEKKGWVWMSDRKVRL